MARRVRGAARWIIRAGRERVLGLSRRGFVRLARPSYKRTLALVADRAELGEVLNRRGLLGIGVEVGVKEAEFSELILESWRGERLISVDSWSPADDPALSQAEHDALRENAGRRLARFGTRSEIRRLTSTVAAREISPHSLDFVYIDAAHDYESISADIAAWFDRVRPGGLLCGHDYYDGMRHGKPYGVRRAVNELCERRGLKLAVTLFDLPKEASWFVVPSRLSGVPTRGGGREPP